MRAALLLLVLLAGCTDRGVCLRSHKAMYWQPIYMTFCTGKTCTMTQTGGYLVEYDACDEWQYPDGKPQ